MKMERSVFSVTFAASSGRVKLGHPVPDSNLSSELNSGSPDHVHVDAVSVVVPVLVVERRLRRLVLGHLVLYLGQRPPQLGVARLGVVHARTRSFGDRTPPAPPRGAPSDRWTPARTTGAALCRRCSRQSRT